MRAMVAWWDLSASDQTIQTLRNFLRDEAVDAWNRQPGLIYKFWIADQEHNRWGAVFIWESAEASAPPHPRSAAELIGYPPTQRAVFDIEAVAEGIHELAGISSLAGLGRALQV